MPSERLKKKPTHQAFIASMNLTILSLRFLSHSGHKKFRCPNHSGRQSSFVYRQSARVKLSKNYAAQFKKLGAMYVTSPSYLKRHPDDQLVRFKTKEKTIHFSDCNARGYYPSLTVWENIR